MYVSVKPSPHQVNNHCSDLKKKFVGEGGDREKNKSESQERARTQQEPVSIIISYCLGGVGILQELESFSRETHTSNPEPHKLKKHPGKARNT
jgi:hypothetical protein